MIERAIDIQKVLYLCFIIFQKAFDTVKHERMMEMLQDTGLDEKKSNADNKEPVLKTKSDGSTRKKEDGME